MKKRILSFALVLIFCFSMIGTADLHDEHSHVHAAGQITSLREIKITDKTIEETQKYIDFKTAGTKGIKECEIRSIILPLLADHVLREANHYFRILKD